MSKKQAIINKFFQPKAKDFVLSSELLRIKPRSFLRTKNDNNNSKTSSNNIVISLLSSDEDDEMTSGIEETSDNLSMKVKNEETNQVSSSAETLLNNKSDELVAAADFLDVVLQEQKDSFDMNKNDRNSSLEEFTDYKLSNFSSMIDWVLNDESNYHLFNEDDWNVIENFKSMSGKIFLMLIDQNYILVFIFSSFATTLCSSVCKKTSMDKIVENQLS